MTPGTIAFDLDGTLISCGPRQKQALRSVSKLSAQCIEKAWHLKRDGLNTRDALIRIGTDPVQADSIVDAWMRIIESPSVLCLDTVLEGADEALRRCRREGFEVALVTARQSVRMLHAQLKALHLLPLCDQVICVDPANAPVEKSRHLDALSPIVFLGDTESDAQAAARADVPFVAVSSGQRGEQFLARRGIVPYFPGIFDAIEHVLADRFVRTGASAHQGRGGGRVDR